VKLYRAAQMRAADAGAVAAGVPGPQLMDAAGKAVARVLRERLPLARRALVLAGRGNNGGDGYVAAAALKGAGVEARVLELAAEPSTDDARAARSAFVTAGGAPALLAPAVLADGLAWADVVVDALLGCGLDRPLSGALADVVRSVNDAGVPVVAVDVPTGVDADVAVPPGPHVQAAVTVEMAGPKVAAAFHPARAAYGERVVADIGTPAPVLDEASDTLLLDDAAVRSALPPRAVDGHKYGAGTVTIVAGSERYLGAAELASRAAWRGGAGLVTLVAPARHPSAWPETILEPHDLSAATAHDARPAVLPHLWPPAGLERRRAGACVIGPGLDRAGLTALDAVLAWAPGPVVLDATALDPSAWTPARRASLARRGNAVLTPHAGEAARLLDVAPSAVRRDPLGSAATLAERFGAVVVLKGATTVVRAPDGAEGVSLRGHPGMASGGTGDALAGLLGALLAAPPDPNVPGREPSQATPDRASDTVFQRACLAVWLHGVAGERAAARWGNGLVASDLIDEIPAVLHDLGW
jgi:ADP-dependent NAD(P)H-hydrate dehydratase / NAD(P)H-hydrate epimerase